MPPCIVLHGRVVSMRKLGCFSVVWRRRSLSESHACVPRDFLISDDRVGYPCVYCVNILPPMLVSLPGLGFPIVFILRSGQVQAGLEILALCLDPVYWQLTFLNIKSILTGRSIIMGSSESLGIDKPSRQGLD